jgi:rhodanese-related sulfurtransferase
MKNLLLLALLGLTLAITACDKKTETTTTSEKSEAVSMQDVPGPGKVMNMSAKELNQWFQRPELKFTVLDVRTPQEFATGSLPGAVNVDFLTEDFKAQADKLDKDATWVVVCQVGRRSASAAEQLAGLGFRQIWALDGGLDAWSAAGYPLAK